METSRNKFNGRFKPFFLLLIALLFTGVNVARAATWQEEMRQFYAAETPNGAGCVDYGNGAQALHDACSFVGNMWQGCVGVLFAIAGIIVVYSSMQIYIKMNCGEEGIKKDILRVFGACIFLIGSTIVMPAFYGYEVTPNTKALGTNGSVSNGFHTSNGGTTLNPGGFERPFPGGTTTGGTGTGTGTTGGGTTVTKQELNKDYTGTKVPTKTP